MGLLLSAFRIRFPELKTADDALVNACLAEALLQLDAEVWGAKLDAAQGLLTAHLLAVSPYGQNARLSKPDGTSTYGVRFREMCLQVSQGWRNA